MKKLYTALLTCSLSTILAQSPVFTGTLINKKNEGNIERTSPYAALDTVFKTYTVYELNVYEISNYIKSNPTNSSIRLKLEDQHDWQLRLQVHDVFAPNFIHTVQTPSGTITLPTTEPYTYQGYANGEKEKISALSIKADWFSGIIQADGKEYFIDPLKRYMNGANANQVVVYEAGSGIDSQEAITCTAGKGDPILDEITRAKESAATSCTEIAVAYDQGFKTLHGGTSGVSTIIASRLNLVSAFYKQWFAIDYKLVELYEAAANEITPDNNKESCQEISAAQGCSEGTILDDFRDWGNGAPATGFKLGRDVATFWTSRDIVDGSNALNIGYSHFAGICNDKGYNLCEDAVRYRGNEDMQRTLWCHELGHTWNAYHCCPTNEMMNSNVTQPATTASSGTVNSITAHKNSRTCLTSGECVITSIHEANPEDLIIVYPNPASDRLFLNIGSSAKNEGIVKAGLYNVIGEHLQTFRLSDQQEEYVIELSSYPEGIYSLRVETTTRFETFKVIVINR